METLSTGRKLSETQLSEANHSGFFRDPFVWETLREKVLPALVKRKESWQFYEEKKKLEEIVLRWPLRVLVSGCSSGDEAYSVAILLKELGLNFEMDAIDIDEKRISEAKSGLFDENHLINVSKERIETFFERKNNGFEIKKDLFKIDFFVADTLDFLAELVETTPGKELSHWTPTGEVFKHHYDLIFCRNVLHYFDESQSKKLVAEIRNCLYFEGYIVFGTDDPIPSNQRLECVHVSERIFRDEKALDFLFLKEREPGLEKAESSLSKYETRIAGLGGTGSMVLNRLENANKDNVREFGTIAADTNICPLTLTSADITVKFLVGRSITQGLGCGGGVNIAKAAWNSSLERLDKTFFDGTKKLFLIAGGGGATGTIGALLLSERAKELGVGVCVILTKPLKLEGKRRLKMEDFVEEISENANLLIIIDHETIFEGMGRDKPISDCFLCAEEIIVQLVVELAKSKIELSNLKEATTMQITGDRILFKIASKEFIF